MLKLSPFGKIPALEDIKRNVVDRLHHVVAVVDGEMLDKVADLQQFLFV